MPKVSVIIPTHNREKYIVGAINSVLSQTFSDFEIIVVDDNSTDNTEKIIKNHFKDKVIYLRKSRGGPASARNMGMNIARGEYIAFLDSDDLWLPEKLKVQTHFMDTHPEFGLTFTGQLSFKETKTGQLEDFPLSSFRETPTIKLLLRANFISTLTVMVRKTCIEDTKGFDEIKDLMVGEDYELWIRIAMKYKIACIPKVLARYRVHDKSLWGNAPVRKRAEAYFTVINRIKEKFPDLITEIFGNEKKFYADRYRCFGNQVSFSTNPEEKAKFYREMMRLKKIDLITLLKYFYCCLILKKRVL